MASIASIGGLALLVFLAAIVATVLAFVFIVPEKKREKLNKFGKFLHDTANFKYLIIEKILQALYIFTTAYVFLLGFCMLFYVQKGVSLGSYRVTPDVWFGGYGIAMMILGPIIIRLIYEGIMMLILLVKNVIQINNKLRATTEEKETPAAPVWTAPAASAPAAPAAPAQAQKFFCTNCGAEVPDSDDFCTNCGKRVR